MRDRLVVLLFAGCVAPLEYFMVLAGTQRRAALAPSSPACVFFASLHFPIASSGQLAPRSAAETHGLIPASLFGRRSSPSSLSSTSNFAILLLYGVIVR